jgi:hypothetical protein
VELTTADALDDGTDGADEVDDAGVLDDGNRATRLGRTFPSEGNFTSTIS